MSTTFTAIDSPDKQCIPLTEIVRNSRKLHTISLGKLLISQVKIRFDEHQFKTGTE